MDLTELLFTAFTLLGVGMTFVFLFLGLLLIAVKLLERYVPADLPVTQKRKKTRTRIQHMGGSICKERARSSFLSTHPFASLRADV